MGKYFRNACTRLLVLEVKIVMLCLIGVWFPNNDTPSVRMKFLISKWDSRWGQARSMLIPSGHFGAFFKKLSNFFFLVTLHYLFKEKLLSANINSFFEETSVVAKVIYLFVHYSVVCALLKCVKIWKRRYFVNLLNLVILLKNRIITEYFVCIYGVLSLLCCKYICYGFLPFVCIFYLWHFTFMS